MIIGDYLRTNPDGVATAGHLPPGLAGAAGTGSGGVCAGCFAAGDGALTARFALLAGTGSLTDTGAGLGDNGAGL